MLVRCIMSFVSSKHRIGSVRAKPCANATTAGLSRREPRPWVKMNSGSGRSAGRAVPPNAGATCAL